MRRHLVQHIRDIQRRWPAPQLPRPTQRIGLVGIRRLLRTLADHADEILTRAEMTVDRRPRDPGRRPDLLQPGLRLGLQQLYRRPRDPLDVLLGVRAPAPLACLT